MFFQAVLLAIGLNAVLVAGGNCNPGECPKDDGPKLTLLPVPWDCKQYIMCQWGIAHYRPCGFGLYYDHSRTVCLPPYMTECKMCKLKEIPIDGANSSNPNDDINTTPQEVVNDEGIEQEESVTEKSIEEETKDGTNDPNPTIGEGEVNDCRREEAQETPAVENDPSPANNISQKCIQNSVTPVKCPENMTDDRLMPHPDDCELFYYCVDFVTPICRDCPANLHFNPIKKVCDHPESAGCSKPALLLSSDLKPGGTCEFHPNQGPDTAVDLFPNPDDCATYFECVCGQLVLLQCQDGQHFNPSLLICDNPEGAGCRNPVPI